jgi:hypothetical protein
MAASDKTIDEMVGIIGKWRDEVGITHASILNLLTKISEVKGNASFTATVLRLRDFYSDTHYNHIV